MDILQEKLVSIIKYVMFSSATHTQNCKFYSNDGSRTKHLACLCTKSIARALEIPELASRILLFTLKSKCQNVFGNNILEQ